MSVETYDRLLYKEKTKHSPEHKEIIKKVYESEAIITVLIVEE